MKTMSENRKTLQTRSLAATGAAWALLASAALAQDAIVPQDFPTIGAAVQGATDVDGDGAVEILVRAGTYLENVRIQRSDIRLEGEDRATTIVRGNGLADTIRIENAFEVWLRNLTITGGGTLGDGVELSRASACRIENCVFTDNRDGLSLRRAAGNVITGCDVRGNSSTGIKVNSESHGVIVDGNTISGNANHGIDAIFADGVRISGNTVGDNGGNGCRVGGGTACTVASNRFERNGSNGILSGRATRNVFVANMCDANRSDGIRLRETSEYLISGNSFTNNLSWGIRRREWNQDDWDAGAAGVQEPVGANVATGNRSGVVRSDN